MRTTRLFPLMLAAAGALLVTTATAQQRVVVYRCTDATGAVTLQNDRPCPRGSAQDKRVIQAAPATPAATAATGTNNARPGGASAAASGTATAGDAGRTGAGTSGAAAATADTAAIATTTAPPTADTATAGTLTAAPTTAALDRAPPPALFECRTFDDNVYLGETANPAPRCAPMSVTGLGGTAAPTAAACRMVTDRCEPVPAEQLCERWRQRLREMDAALTFGRLDANPSARVDVDRVRGVVTESVCGL